VNNCQLYIKHEIEAYGLGFIMVTFDGEADLAINVTDLPSDDMTIETDELALTYLPGYDAEGVYFSLLDKKT